MQMQDNSSFQTAVAAALEKTYEARSQQQHHLLAALLVQSLPHCSAGRASRLSFHLRVAHPHEEFSAGSILLQQQSPDSHVFSYHLVRQPAGREEGQFYLCVDGVDVRSCDSMQSVEEEILFLRDCHYLQDIPRKRLHHVLRNAHLTRITYGHEVYCQGELIPDEGAVYLVREGEFLFSRSDPTGHNTPLLAFKKGYIFGHQRGLPQDEDNPQRQHRSLTVSCKSSHGVLYKFSQQFFSLHLYKFCEHELDLHSKRVEALLEKQRAILKSRQDNGQFLTQKIRRSASSKLQPFTASRISFSRQSARPAEKEEVVDIMELKMSYQSLKLQQPPRNKLYSKGELVKMFYNPEKNESDYLLWQASKCQRLKEVAKPHAHVPTRSEILFSFTNATLLFQRNRRKSTR